MKGATEFKDFISLNTIITAYIGVVSSIAAYFLWGVVEAQKVQGEQITQIEKKLSWLAGRYGWKFDITSNIYEIPAEK